MSWLIGVLSALLSDLGVRDGRVDRGATAVEYAIMVSFIAVVIVLAVGALGLSVSGLFQSFLVAMNWA